MTVTDPNDLMQRPAEPAPGMIVESHAGEPYVVLPVESPEERIKALEELFAEWLADDTGYDAETLPQLKAALDETRKSVSARPLFDD